MCIRDRLWSEVNSFKWGLAELPGKGPGTNKGMSIRERNTHPRYKEGIRYFVIREE